MSEEQSQAGFKPRPRIQTLSDLIFGLALSIGALTLIGQQPADFQAILLSLAFFSFSFLVLVGVWRSYSSILSVLPVETEQLVSLNILLLFTVSIEPYLFNELFAVGGDSWNGVSVIYAADLAVMFLVLAFFNHSLGKEEKGWAPKSFLKKFRFERNYDLVVATIFLVSYYSCFPGKCEFGVFGRWKLFPAAEGDCLGYSAGFRFAKTRDFALQKTVALRGLWRIGRVLFGFGELRFPFAGLQFFSQYAGMDDE